MDRGKTGTIIRYGHNHVKAIDHAVYLNFVSKDKNVTYYAIEHKDGENLVVSDDTLEILDNVVIHTLFRDYADMQFDHVHLIAGDTEPLHHWNEIRDMVSTLDESILCYLIQFKIPMELFARQELFARGLNADGKWIGFDKAWEYWKNYKSK